jgi:hypothetical protein
VDTTDNRQKIVQSCIQKNVIVFHYLFCINKINVFSFLISYLFVSSVCVRKDDHVRDCMVVGFTTTCAITTKVVSSKSFMADVYLIQQYEIKFVSDLRQVGGFLWFPPPIKLTATI